MKIKATIFALIYARIIACYTYQPSKTTFNSKQSKVNRVILGRNANKREFPFAASVLSLDGSQFRTCAAAIIDPQWIITSAICVEYGEYKTKPRNFRVGVGSTDRRKQQYVKVSQVLPYPNFNDQSLYPPNNIALLKLEKKLDFDGDTESLRIYANGTNDTSNEVLLLGWENINTLANPVASPELVVKGTKLQSREFCQRNINSAIEITGPKKNSTISDNYCTKIYPDAGNSCYNDAGALLVTKDSDGKYILLGISAFGDNPEHSSKPNCKSQAGAAYYSRLGMYTDFVQKRVGADSGQVFVGSERGGRDGDRSLSLSKSNNSKNRQLSSESSDQLATDTTSESNGESNSESTEESNGESNSESTEESNGESASESTSESKSEPNVEYVTVLGETTTTVDFTSTVISTINSCSFVLGLSAELVSEPILSTTTVPNLEATDTTSAEATNTTDTNDTTDTNVTSRALSITSKTSGSTKKTTSKKTTNKSTQATPRSVALPVIQSITLTKMISEFTLFTSTHVSVVQASMRAANINKSTKITTKTTTKVIPTKTSRAVVLSSTLHKKSTTSNVVDLLKANNSLLSSIMHNIGKTRMGIAADSNSSNDDDGSNVQRALAKSINDTGESQGPASPTTVVVTKTSNVISIRVNTEDVSHTRDDGGSNSNSDDGTRGIGKVEQPKQVQVEYIKAIINDKLKDKGLSDNVSSILGDILI